MLMGFAKNNLFLHANDELHFKICTKRSSFAAANSFFFILYCPVIRIDWHLTNECDVLCSFMHSVLLNNYIKMRIARLSKRHFRFDENYDIEEKHRTPKTSGLMNASGALSLIGNADYIYKCWSRRLCDISGFYTACNVVFGVLLLFSPFLVEKAVSCRPLLLMVSFMVSNVSYGNKVLVFWWILQMYFIPNSQ